MLLFRFVSRNMVEDERDDKAQVTPPPPPLLGENWAYGNVAGRVVLVRLTALS